MVRTTSPNKKPTKKPKKVRKPIYPIQKQEMGRPPIYNPESHPDQAHKFCLLGCTDVRLASLFDVSVQTIDYWKREHPEFLKAIKEGREIADANVAKSTYNRATGYNLEEKEWRRVRVKGEDGKPIKDDNGNYIYEMVLVKIVNKHVPADPALNKFWLWNRTKFKPKEEQWTDKQDIAIGGPNGEVLNMGNVVVVLPPEKSLG